MLMAGGGLHSGCGCHDCSCPQFPMGPGPDGPMGAMGAMEPHHMNGSLGGCHGKPGKVLEY